MDLDAARFSFAENGAAAATDAAKEIMSPSKARSGCTPCRRRAPRGALTRPAHAQQEAYKKRLAENLLASDAKDAKILAFKSKARRAPPPPPPLLQAAAAQSRPLTRARRAGHAGACAARGL